MVKSSRLKLDDSLFKKKKEPALTRGRIENALAVNVVLAAVMLLLLALTTRKENWWAIFLIGLLFLASELFAIPMKSGGRMSLALLPVVMAMMISGPLGAALVPLFGIPIFYMERGEQEIRRILYNTGQLVFAAGAAGWVFHHTGGQLLQGDLSNGGKLVFPWIMATLVFFVLNTILVSPALASPDDKITRFWMKNFVLTFPGYILYSGIGFLAAIAYIRLEFAAVVLLFAPLVGIRVVYTRYGRMRNVCDETTLAIIEAVEGEGMFSSGHSIGVADMAVAIAQAMNFQEEDLHYLRQAALLHDVGKLALDPSLFDKPGELTAEEYEQVKKHPLIAANIVSKEPSFMVVAPSITHHHEMVDGSGYVDGLSGDTIPVGARILAVADAFDAMQRTTPYREAMDPYAAASEIIRAKGVQFDPEVIDAFIKVVTGLGVWKGSLKEGLRMPLEEEASPEMEQPTLDEAAAQAQVEAAPGEETKEAVTPAEGIVYTEMKDEIEKDIREWKSSEGERKRRRDKDESRRRKAPRWKKKGKKGEGP